MDERAGTQTPVSSAEAVAIGLDLLRRGQREDAEKLFGWILEIEPDHPDALHFSGWLAHRRGSHEEAVALIQRSLALAPGYVDAHSNLGIVFKALGRLDESIACCQRAIELNPAHVNAYSNLGVLLRATGKPVEAEAAYRTAIRLDPDHVDALHNLGTLLIGLRRTREAVECYCRVTTLCAKHPQAREALARAHCTLGEIDEAVEIFERWLREEPDHPIARHMLAACSGRAVPSRASNAYVEATFDEFASTFDAKLEMLSYRAPELVCAALDAAGLPRARALDVLDAGCGTGLCGPGIAAYARRLVGVDLSARMLERAAERGIYDELRKGELTEYLEANPDAFDVIVSADTLVYFGALEAVIGSAARALRCGGVLVFSIEAGEVEGADHALGSHGRYSHARGYVERVLRKACLAAEITPAELRMEAGLPVNGWVVRATRCVP